MNTTQPVPPSLPPLFLAQPRPSRFLLFRAEFTPFHLLNVCNRLVFVATTLCDVEKGFGFHQSIIANAPLRKGNSGLKSEIIRMRVTTGTPN